MRNIFLISQKSILHPFMELDHCFLIIPLKNRLKFIFQMFQLDAPHGMELAQPKIDPIIETQVTRKYIYKPFEMLRSPIQRHASTDSRGYSWRP